MDNQGIEARTLLYFENLCDRDWIECISSESIHCFCGQADDFARVQKRYRLHPLAGGNDFCFHFGTRWAITASVCFFRNASNFLRAPSWETARMLTASSAAPPAPAIITRNPLSAALRAKSAVASGLRCAERILCSLGTASSSRSWTEWRMVSQSDVLPMTTATNAEDFDIA